MTRKVFGRCCKSGVWFDNSSWYRYVYIYMCVDKYVQCKYIYCMCWMLVGWGGSTCKVSLPRTSLDASFDKEVAKCSTKSHPLGVAKDILKPRSLRVVLIIWVVPLPSNSAKWRFRLGSPSLKIYSIYPDSNYNWEEGQPKLHYTSSYPARKNR